MERILKLSVIIVYAILLKSCSDDDDNATINGSSIHGTWQLTESYMDTGDGTGDWETAEGIYTYTFLKNGTFTSSQFSKCNTGTYVLNENQLTLNYACDTLDEPLKIADGKLVAKIKYNESILELTPIEPACVEGCGYRFEKTLITTNGDK
ncbi:lipocalin family protein [Galbibacter sp. PAP.153]|uniref:lipocalin family protein n=1 Tax=Galbibacter sp. PAP.153 TaxID=3104623 RepID=UPI00300A6889